MSLVSYFDDTKRFALQVVIDNDVFILDTQNTKLNLRDKKIKSIWLRTIANLHISKLDISYNMLTFLPSIFSLRSLNCSNCAILHMPRCMPMLEELDCSNNLISTLHTYPKLKTLTCSDNLVREVPKVDKITAHNCPILVKYSDPLMYKRSGIIRNGKFQWVENKNIEAKYVIIDWHLAKTTIKFKTKIAVQVAKFLFNQY